MQFTSYFADHFPTVIKPSFKDMVVHLAGVLVSFLSDTHRNPGFSRTPIYINKAGVKHTDPQMVLFSFWWLQIVSKVQFLLLGKSLNWSRECHISMHLHINYV